MFCMPRCRCLRLLLLLASSQAAAPPSYTKRVTAFCASIDCSGSACRGGFHYGNESLADCEKLCTTNDCTCFDSRDSSPHPSPQQPNCRLTNTSGETKQSGYGYDAYVNTEKPSPSPSPPAWINYACRKDIGLDKFKFCDTSMTIEQRLDNLVGLMTAEEKASQLQARSCPPIDRLGVPFFCWGQNWIHGNFPIPPGMAATWNMSAIKGMAQDAAQDTRYGFNQRTENHSHSYSCPGSIVTWGPTMNIVRDPRWGRNFETPSECPFLTAEYVRNFVEGAQVSLRLQVQSV
jgi:hypothetical protein